MFIRGWINGLYVEFYTDNPEYLEILSETVERFEYDTTSYKEKK